MVREKKWLDGKKTNDDVMDFIGLWILGDEYDRKSI